jgi:prepilin peptidase CpaA
VLGRTDELWISLAIAGVSTLAVFTDFRFRKVPNWLTLTATVLALGFHWAMPSGLSFAGSLLGAGVGLLFFIPLFIPGWVGAGDAKLLMVFGSWGGPHFAMNVAFWSIAMGAALAVVQLALRGTLLDFARRFWSFLRAWVFKELEPMAFRVDRGATLPFAIPMAIAALGYRLEQLPEVIQWLR